MRSARLAATSIAVILTAGCGDTPTASPGTRSSIAGVEVVRVDDGVQITNGTDQPLAFAVWARGFLGLFAPCVDTSPNCPRLAPGANVLVSLDQIDGIWDGETEAIVRWWRVVPDGAGGYRAEGLREVIITL